jgi:hypothetical protein
MSRINIGRLFLGGLVAGVVANALDYVTNMYLMKEEMDDMVQRLNLVPETVDASFRTWIVVDFILGLLLVFTYAGFRPRFGPGPKTAVVASVTVWAAASAMVAGFAAMGLFTEQAFIKGAALTLVTSVVAGLVGASLYKE